MRLALLRHSWYLLKSPAGLGPPSEPPGPFEPQDTGVGKRHPGARPPLARPLGFCRLKGLTTYTLTLQGSASPSRLSKLP